VPAGFTAAVAPGDPGDVLHVGGVSAPEFGRATRTLYRMSLPRVLGFDVYGTLVDPIGLSRRLARRVGGEADRVAVAWRHKQLEYTFRLTAMERYEDFAWVTERALAFALAAAGRTLNEGDRAALLAAYADLEPFADVGAGLTRLREAGHALAVLSNGTPAMLEAVLTRGGLRPHFDDVISADEVRAYKPSPRVYRHAAGRLGRPPHEVCLVSSNPFDVVGATATGMRAAWVNRSGQPFDTLAPPPRVVVSSLTDLAAALATEG
jgi:2-haloacid dehalogenase